MIFAVLDVIEQWTLTVIKLLRFFVLIHTTLSVIAPGETKMWAAVSENFFHVRGSCQNE